MATAVANAQSAYDKTVKLSGVDGAITSNLAVRVNDGAAGSIHSSYKNTSTNQTIVKDQFTSTNPGWFLGWELSGGIIYPAINIGTAERYLKYSTSGGLEVKGSITATTGTFEGNVTAGNVTIGPGGISHPQFNINSDGSANFSGTLQAGTILSEGSVTGSTITGGIIQTGGTSATRRIVLSGSQPDRIDFYPKTGDDADVPGYLWVSDDAGSASLPGLVIVPPTKSTWLTPPKIKMTQTGGAGGFLDLSAVQISLTGTVKINTYAYHVGNVAVAVNAHRNISAGVDAPSGGSTGDVYIQYG